MKSQRNRKGQFIKGSTSNNKGKHLSEDTKQKLRIKATGRKHTKATRDKMSKSRQNHKHKPETIKKIVASRKGYKHSSATKMKLSIAHMGKKKVEGAYEFPKGEKHPNWKGGITPINESIRKSLEYKLWRMAVYQRDKYTCIWCGYKGGLINADHIKPFAEYPELRFAIDNGRTLCIDCHRKTSTYGRGKL